MTYNHTEQIMKEGVYYVSFLYEIIDQYKLEKEELYAQKNRNWDEVDENLKYNHDFRSPLEKDLEDLGNELESEFDKLGKKSSKEDSASNIKDGVEIGGNSFGGKRMLRSHFYYKNHGHHAPDRKFLNDPYQSEYSKQPRLIVTGSITFKNTHGFLSAQQYKNIEINMWFFVTFTILSALWSLDLYRKRDKILPIHYLVSVVLYASWFESLFTWMFYSYENKDLGDYTTFWVFISFM